VQAVHTLTQTETLTLTQP